MEIQFGPGAAWGERVDLGTVSGLGPVQFAIMQDIAIDFTFTNKPLRGQNIYPIVNARAEGKISGKLKSARVFGAAWSDMIFGVTPSVGQFGVSQHEPETVPGTTPFQITVTNAASYNDDLGVYYAATAGKFTRVTTPSAAGQYSVNLATGVYTFSSADAGLAVLISYTYNITSSGTLINITNALAGTQPYFKFTFFQKVSPTPPGLPVAFRPLALRLNACSIPKLSITTKIDDFTFQDIDFETHSDLAGNIGYLSSVE